MSNLTKLHFSESNLPCINGRKPMQINQVCTFIVQLHHYPIKCHQVKKLVLLVHITPLMLTNSFNFYGNLSIARHHLYPSSLQKNTDSQNYLKEWSAVPNEPEF